MFGATIRNRIRSTLTNFFTSLKPQTIRRFNFAYESKNDLNNKIYRK